jgi:hypothetical protein
MLRWATRWTSTICGYVIFPQRHEPKEPKVNCGRLSTAIIDVIAEQAKEAKHDDHERYTVANVGSTISKSQGFRIGYKATD